MTKEWRPEGWAFPPDTETEYGKQWCYYGQKEAFEAGASAMLEALKKMGNPVCHIQTSEDEINDITQVVHVVKFGEGIHATDLKQLLMEIHGKSKLISIDSENSDIILTFQDEEGD